MVHLDISLLLVVSLEVIPDVYVLSASVFNRIIRHADCTLIVTYEWDFAQIEPKSQRVCLIQSSCAQHCPAATYSASAVDRATDVCFFELQDTRDLPRNWHVPNVLFLSTLHPA
jgi:hypothetical protein